MERSLCRAKILQIQRTGRAIFAASGAARLVTHFGESKTQSRASRAFCHEANPSGGILAHVVNGCLAGLERDGLVAVHLLCQVQRPVACARLVCAVVDADALRVSRQPFHGQNLWPFVGAYLAFEVGTLCGGKPVGCVIFGCGPSVLEPCIVVFSVVDVAVAPRAVPVRGPRRVRTDSFLRPVLVAHHKHSFEGHFLVAEHAVRDAPAPPTAAQSHANGVLSLTEQICDVVRHVECCFVEIR